MFMILAYLLPRLRYPEKVSQANAFGHDDCGKKRILNKKAAITYISISILSFTCKRVDTVRKQAGLDPLPASERWIGRALGRHDCWAVTFWEENRATLVPYV